MCDIRHEVHLFVVENFLFGSGTVADGTSFLETGIVDSTGVLELVGFLETQYGITIEDRELVPANLDSIDNVVAFVTRKTREHSLAG